MQIQNQPPLHLTYCLNIHPGETWAENFAAIREKALRVKELIAPDRPFGLGLRLSRRAADSLAEDEPIGMTYGNSWTIKAFTSSRSMDFRTDPSTARE